MTDKFYRLPDGSGFGEMSFPLPQDHWIYGDPSREQPIEPGSVHTFEPPPMPFRMGTSHGIQIRIIPPIRDFSRFTDIPSSALPPVPILTRQQMAEHIRSAAQYAIRASTMKGKEDYDPDALVQNLIVGLLGYWTSDGLSGDDWANPKQEK